MKTAIPTLAATAIATAIALAAATAALPARAAADDTTLERLATCQDSWFEWKDDESRMANLAGFFQTKFGQGSNPGGFAPKGRMSVLGQSVAQVFPQSVGMGVGFSVVVNAPFVRVRQALEKQLGKPLACNSGDGMRGCEMKLSEKKNIVLMAPESPTSGQTLMGCYYFYEK